MMNQWRTILAVTIVAVAGAAAFVWHEGSQDGDATPALAQPAAPVSAPIRQPTAPLVASEPAPAVPSEPPAAPAQPEVTQAAPSVPVEPPNVDTPEPAQAKFARGGRADPEQN